MLYTKMVKPGINEGCHGLCPGQLSVLDKFAKDKMSGKNLISKEERC